MCDFIISGDKPNAQYVYILWDGEDDCRTEWLPNLRKVSDLEV
jgi:hypothetical protein